MYNIRYSVTFLFNKKSIDNLYIKILDLSKKNCLATPLCQISDN